MNRLNENKFDPKYIYPTNHDAVLSIYNEYFWKDKVVEESKPQDQAVVEHISV